MGKRSPGTDTVVVKQKLINNLVLFKNPQLYEFEDFFDLLSGRIH